MSQTVVFNRGLGESIHLGDDIVVKVIEIKNNRVVLGIDCPKSMPVYLREVFEGIRRSE